MNGILERLWLALIEAAKAAEHSWKRTILFDAPPSVRELTIEGRTWTVRTADGTEETFLGPAPVAAPVALRGGARYRLLLSGAAELRIDAQALAPNGNAGGGGA